MVARLPDVGTVGPMLAVPRRRRAFTILEVTVAIGLLALFAYVATRVLTSFIDGAAAQLERIDIERERAVAGHVLAADLSTARSCRTDRLDSPVQALTATELVFFADPDGDGTVDRVRYVVAGGTLHRYAVADLGDCTFAQPVGEPLLDGLRPGADTDGDGRGDAAFLGWSDGAPVTDATTTLDCSGTGPASRQCAFDLIELHAVSTSTRAGDVAWHQRYPVDSRWSRQVG